MVFRLLTMLFCAGFLLFSTVSFAQDTTDTVPVEPEVYGVDSARLADMFEFIGSELRIDGIMIVRHGETILEVYHHPFRADVPMS